MLISLVRCALSPNDEENQIRSSLHSLTHLGKCCSDRYWCKGALLHGPERTVLVGKGSTRRPSWILMCGYVHRDFTVKGDYLRIYWVKSPVVKDRNLKQCRELICAKKISFKVSGYRCVLFISKITASAKKICSRHMPEKQLSERKGMRALINECRRSSSADSTRRTNLLYLAQLGGHRRRPGGYPRELSKYLRDQGELGKDRSRVV